MAEFGFVEDSVRQHFVEIINEIIRAEGLPLERADAQIEIVERNERGVVRHVKFPDVVVWKKGAALVEGALLIELKQPHYSPFTVEIVEDAFVKASKVGIPYFATCNMRRLILFETVPSDNKLAPLMERRIKVYDLSPMRKARDILRGDIRKILKKNLRECLLEFKDIYMGVKKLPTFPLDELFILNLRDIVSSLSDAFCEALINSFKGDNKFRRGFQRWFAGQGWIPPLNVGEVEKFEQAARQYLYLLAVKLMFYYALKKKMPKLPDIDVPDSIDDGVALKLWLQNYFNLAVEMSQDYETIFGMDFIEKFPIPDGAVDSLKRFIRGLRRYDFDKLGYADLGKIFDKLIPGEERHTLGQYFTTQRHRDGTYWPDVVDLILGFTVKSPDVKILDGACGAGTFLVRAYARLRHFKPDLSHEDLLTRLYGVDISKFAALLSAVNLAIRDLSVEENYPIILNEDFFNVSAGGELGKWVDVKQRIMLLTKGKKRSLKLPYVRAFVGNPPYTRQEEMEEYIEDYKEKLADVVEKEWKIKLGKRSSIYVYFMLHGFKFLEEGGRLGYITSNSWLDVDYGKYLQEFFLKNSKIIAIIESKVERWFEDADINTAITIVEKCEDKKKRNDNLVRFVQLKKKLEDIIPTSSEDDRWEAIDRLVKKIESIGEYYEDEMMRVFPKKQEELWSEGYDEESGKYVGSKWGKYIRAPEIFFKILEKAGDKLIPLEKIATVRRGFTTGANEFFYLKDEDIRRWGIEREFWMHPVTRKEWEKIKDLIPEEDIWLDKNGEYFKRSQYAEKYKLDDVLIDGGVVWIPNYVVKSPRECRSIIVDPKHLKYRVLMIHKDKEELKG
ncbi:MAG: restriction endonuclease subunit M, partial [Thaumarchaeota archaeon]|nr:restriction endonuclease subunit M [Nitrososphaerota archaeon]